MVATTSLLTCAFLALFIQSPVLGKPQQCQLPPKWTINGIDPVAEARAKGKSQARALEGIRNVLAAYPYAVKGGGVRFMILNGYRAASTFSWYKGKIGYPAYQEPANKRYWQMLNGGKDDIIIYDRCGRLSAQIKMPRSNLGKYTHVQTALFQADRNSVCGQKCGQRSTSTTAPTQQPTTTGTGTAAPTANGTATGTAIGTATGPVASTATGMPAGTTSPFKKSKKSQRKKNKRRKNKKPKRPKKLKRNKKRKKTRKSQG